jgi:DNA helicase HerA-like ATPase
VLGQLGNRIQHALRAYTPRDMKSVKTAAETFVPNPKIDVARVISELGVGEALVSTLQEKGVPMPVERIWVCPPRSRMGAITPEERAAVRARSPVGAKYDTTVDRESAEDMLARRADEKVAEAGDGEAPASAPASRGGGGRAAPAPRPAPVERSKFDEFLWGTKRRQGAVEAAAKSATRTMATGLGRQIVRGVLGSLFGGRKR